MSPQRSLPIRVVELASLGVFFVLFGRHVLGIVATWHGPVAILSIVPGALLGYVASDIASGIGHWFCDNFFEEDTPVIGSLIIAPFREHHRDPLALTRHSFAELTGNSALVLTPVMLVGPTGSPFWQAFLVQFAIGIILTNLIHAWAHQERVHPIVRALQEAHIILPPAHHDLHHRGAHDRAYCVTTGWANPILEAGRFFVVMQRVLVSIGIRARKAT